MRPRIKPTLPVQTCPPGPLPRPSVRLWRQLEPQLQKQLAQHWAKLIQQARPTSPAGEGREQVGD